MEELIISVGKSLNGTTDKELDFYYKLGVNALEDPTYVIREEVQYFNAEASKRVVLFAKPKEGYQVYKRMIVYYAGVQMLQYIRENSMEALLDYLQAQPNLQREEFENLGSQLIAKSDFINLIADIKADLFNDWDGIHQAYHALSDRYPESKLQHAIASLAELRKENYLDWDKSYIDTLLQEVLETQRWICKEIYRSRSKDYQSSFKLMVYDSMEEMDAVVGKLEDNPFINKQNEELALLEQELHKI